MAKGLANLSCKLKFCQGFNLDVSAARPHTAYVERSRDQADDLCAGSDISTAFRGLLLVRGLRELPQATSPHVRSAEDFNRSRLRVIASFSTRDTFSAGRE